MQKNILILMKGPLDQAVPIISIAQHLANMGCQVSVGCGTCSVTLQEYLQEAGIQVTELTTQQLPNTLPQVVRKLLEWGNFRLHVQSLIGDRSKLFYIGSADTAISLMGLLPKREYILHLRELHDTQPLYMKALSHIARNALHVVVPEINRAHLYQKFLRLKQLPTVIPNKPFSNLGQTRLAIDFLPAEMREKIASQKCLIYQGGIGPDRDLSPVLRALAKSPDYAFIVMGRDYGPLDSYRKILPELIHIPFVAPPLHLNVTSWAHVGLLTYDNLSLNTVYCAPNKIWEYSGFGLPMLCSENLGLRYTVGVAGAAELVNLEDSEAVLLALRRIEMNYEVMREHSLKFFNSLDVPQVLRKILPAHFL